MNCACGAPLELEMERDATQCVECQKKHATKEYVVTIRQKGAPELEQRFEAHNAQDANYLALAMARIMGYHHGRVTRCEVAA